MITALIGLWLVPVVGYFLTRRTRPLWLWRITGTCLGAIASPALMGLYGLYFLGPLAALVGLVAFPLLMLHSWPGYDLAIALRLVEPRTVVKGVQHLYVWSLDGLVWASVYGTLGFVADRLLQRRRIASHAKSAA